MNNRIEKVRKTLGLTMEKFGERIGGVSKSTISNIEHGNRDLTEHMFKSICREFNVSEEWLRDGTGEMFSLPEDETAALVSGLLEDPDNEFYSMILNIVRTYEQLQPDAQEVLKDFCKQLVENAGTRKD